MTAEDIEKILKDIPQHLADVHPITILTYLDSKLYDGISTPDKYLIIANYVIRNVPQQQRIKPWDLVEIDINNKYEAIPGVDINYLFPWLRLVHAQGSSDLVITKVQIKN